MGKGGELKLENAKQVDSVRRKFLLREGEHQRLCYFSISSNS